MSGRETRVRIGALAVGGGFDARRFTRLVTEQVERDLQPDRASVQSAIARAARTSGGDRP